MSRYLWLAPWLVLCTTAFVHGADKPALQSLLGKPVLNPHQTEKEWQAYAEAHVPPMPQAKTVAEWEAHANRMRSAVLEQVVFRGEAAGWRDAKTRVEWLATIKGGPGYRIKKLRYEALPGLWIPALLYEPEKLEGKVPVILNVNGHDRNGKAAPYKQIRCINEARRGMLALNLEWFGMGQLRADDFAHGRMNQLDLCGSSGVAPFYLNMKRGLDVLLSLEHADPTRTAVTGLSGGGWQTIFFSSLETRVKLCDPVAGYSSFRTRARHYKDLGDSEQAPCDLGAVADYTHLTAMMAPRPTLLTFNANDNCCFESHYALPPLVQAAAPVYELYGKPQSLRTHINYVPGDHNYEKDNRQAFYRMLGDFFYPGDTRYNAEEIPSEGEVKSAEELKVELPADNQNFHSLALALAGKLPGQPILPGDRAVAQKWQQAAREKLRHIVRAKDFEARAEKVGSEDHEGTTITRWRLHLDGWTVPVVELVRGAPRGTTILINDAGRQKGAADVERLLVNGQRVLAVDLFYFGESEIQPREFLFALQLDSEGCRPLGLQAGELAAVARWSMTNDKETAAIAASGPRSSVIALVASGLEPRLIGRLELQGCLGSLKEIIERNLTVEQMPELFCFGLLGVFDVKHLAALSSPRPVVFTAAGNRARAELAGLKGWYALLGADFQPLR